jgi:branched-subunit amino acid transport protein
MNFFVYLIATAGTTYLVRMLPLVLMKGKIRSRFLLSFLHYIPYAVLSVMTIPAIFSATGDIRTAAAGFVTAMILAWRGKSLLTVAAAACAAVLAAELFL